MAGRGSTCVAVEAPATDYPYRVALIKVQWAELNGIVESRPGCLPVRASCSRLTTARVGRGDPDTWHAFMDGWHALGATHLCLSTMGNGFTSPAQHLAALTRAASELGVGKP
ncbi:MAG: hypothetical protein M3Q03_07900 [Chloroflexota bacterium]|nr:hypothetical protein [Chloroflexota bacterium]